MSMSKTQRPPVVAILAFIAGYPVGHCRLEPLGKLECLGSVWTCAGS